MELVNASTNETLKVLKYQAPSKFTPIKVELNGEEVEARSTSARGKEYTYFPLNGVSVYVTGKLEEGGKYTVEVPEGFKGPAWDGTRKSYYVRKRPVKADGSAAPGGDDPVGEGKVGDPNAPTGTDLPQEPEVPDGEVPAGESGEPAAEGAESPRARRRRG